jgi:uncharacterized protein YraI
MGMTTRLRLGCGALLLMGSAAALAQNAVISDSADLYAGPDNSYPVVAQLESDTPVQVYGCLDDWSWCDVSFEDARGWVFAPVINYQYQGDWVPVYQYAPALGIAVVSFSLGDYWGHYYHSRPWYGQRTEWEHREIHHRRPPGPPPSVRVMPAHYEHGHGPGPRGPGRPDDHAHFDHGAPPPAHRDDHHDDHHDDRHGNAQPPQPPRTPEPPRNEEPQRHEMPQHADEHHAPPPRPETHAAPMTHEAPRPEMHAAPAPREAPHAAPAPHEAPRPSAPPHEEHHEDKPH